jgi:hypothetical protein
MFSLSFPYKDVSALADSSRSKDLLLGFLAASLDEDNMDMDATDIADDRFPLSMRILGTDMLLLDFMLWAPRLRLDIMLWPLMLQVALTLRLMPAL